MEGLELGLQQQGADQPERLGPPSKPGEISQITKVKNAARQHGSYEKAGKPSSPGAGWLLFRIAQLTVAITDAQKLRSVTSARAA